MSAHVRSGADSRTGPAPELALSRNFRHGIAAPDRLCFRHNHYANRPPSPHRSYPPVAFFLRQRWPARRSGRFVSPFRLGLEANPNFVQPQSTQQEIGFVPSFCPIPALRPPWYAVPARGWPSRSPSSSSPRDRPDCHGRFVSCFEAGSLGQDLIPVLRQRPEGQ